MTSIGNKKVFAENLLYYINLFGKSQKEVAEAIGVTTSTFSEWCNAKKYPRIDRIEMLANYFGLNKSDLIEEHKDMPQEDKLTAEIARLARPLTDSKKQAVLAILRQFANESDTK